MEGDESISKEKRRKEAKVKFVMLKGHLELKSTV